jgi:non-canonical (house-cleaning) NTP pyrophosphatase
MKIIVCSTSILKLDAVTDAVRRIWPDDVGGKIWPDGVQIQSDAAPSGVPNQPFGDHQILMGALNRAREVSLRHDGYVVAIENGVATREGGAVARNGRYVDLAYVVVVDPAGRITVRWSQDVPVPTELVIESQASGWTKTCGQLQAARTPGVDHDDPHVVWSGQTTNRRRILTAAIQEALLATYIPAAVRP